MQNVDGSTRSITFKDLKKSDGSTCFPLKGKFKVTKLSAASAQAGVNPADNTVASSYFYVGERSAGMHANHAGALRAALVVPAASIAAVLPCCACRHRSGEAA